MTTVLPTPAPPNAPDLAALDEGADQVDDLDAGLEDLGLGVLIDQRRGRDGESGSASCGRPGPAVHRGAGDVEDAAEHAFADGHRDRGAGVGDRHAAHEALGGGHRDGADHSRRRDAAAPRGSGLLLAGDGEVDGERLVDGRDGVLGELHVDDGTDDLDDFACVAHAETGEGWCVRN